MSDFWAGVIWASGFWIIIYCAAVVCWAIWDIRQHGAEMPNTEAANDRPRTAANDVAMKQWL